jgi:hypothetical protein
MMHCRNLVEEGKHLFRGWGQVGELKDALEKL